MSSLSKKIKTNFIIDVIMFIVMMAIAGLGLLMKYVLIPGKDRWAVYGKNVDLYFLGLDRHEWGSVHLMLSYILLVLLALHIILHWKMILCIYHKLIGQKIIKTISATMFVILSAILIGFPLLINPEVTKGGNHHNKQGLHSNSQNTGQLLKEENISNKHQHKTIASGKKKYFHNFGNTHRNMTLSDISKSYNIPIARLKGQLNIPLKESNNIKLDRLKIKYHFRMQDVREILSNYSG